MTQRPLAILCLHGTCQDAELFSQRLMPLQEKLSSLVSLSFIDAPHSLPLMPGQQVPMRTWWRTRSMASSSALQDTKKSNALDEEARKANEAWANVSLEASLTSWQDVVVQDWQCSMRTITEAWNEHGGFDGVLGFSNGAAAAFALVANSLSNTASKISLPGLKFVISASGYLPDPLSSLIPPSMVETQGEEGPSSWLRSPLTLPSFHFMGKADEAVPLEASLPLSQAFSSSICNLHEKGHFFPTGANELSSLSAFLQQFQPMALHSPKPVKDNLLTSKVISGPPPMAPPTPLGPHLAPIAIDLSSVPPALPSYQPNQDPPLHPPQDQIDEIEALESIFGDEFQMQSGSLQSSPISLSIALRNSETSASQSTPITLTIIFTLPNDYPLEAIPHISLSGPNLDPKSEVMISLHTYLISCAKEFMEMSGGAGCIYQLVEAAREFIDANGQLFAKPIARDLHDHARNEPGDVDMSSLTCEEGKVECVVVGTTISATRPPWWEEEEAEGGLIRSAILKASLRHWGNGRGARRVDINNDDDDDLDEDEPNADVRGGDDDNADDLAQKGRWDYIVGLVGKPSAGKSTFFNATTVDLDPSASTGSEARCASFPFTTIEPNIARGMMAVPDPQASLPNNIHSSPAHGFAPSFDPTRSSDPKLFNLDPLAAWMSNNGSSPSSSFFPWGLPSPDDSPLSSLTTEGKQGRWRKVPILIKDVAGLVPGAYQGRGKGNSFLNDLTDADVLIHVVDASGSADREGQSVGEGQGADPLDDIGWVREEIHRWVFDNVRTKWSGVIKRPSRLPDLFSGYKASRSLVHKVLKRVGLKVDTLEDAGLADWGEADLHFLVATFLQVRFPILLAMNKADMRGAVENIERVRKALPHEPLVSMSAAAERLLCAEARAGRLIYEPGNNRVIIHPCGSTDNASSGEGDVSDGLATMDSQKDGPSLVAQSQEVWQRKARAVQEKVLDALGSTGTMLALTTAVAMRPPLVAFPIGDIHSCTAVPARPAASSNGSSSNQGGGMMMGAGADAKARVMEGSNPSVLRDCVLLKPGSSVYHLFYTLKRPPWSLLESPGDFIRSDCRVMASSISVPTSGESRVLKKDEKMHWDNCVVRMMTNKKCSWQKG